MGMEGVVDRGCASGAVASTIARGIFSANAVQTPDFECALRNDDPRTCDVVVTPRPTLRRPELRLRKRLPTPRRRLAKARRRTIHPPRVALLNARVLNRQRYQRSMQPKTRSCPSSAAVLRDRVDPPTSAPTPAPSRCTDARRTHPCRTHAECARARAARSLALPSEGAPTCPTTTHLRATA